MKIDFVFKRAPAYRIAFLPPTTKYSDSGVRSQFERIAEWARARHYRTGKWIFVYLTKPHHGRFQVAIEVKGRVRGDGKIGTRLIRASKVGSVTFDPDLVAPRVVYFGITDWLRWERSEKNIRSILGYRELYDGNPWTDRKAWSKTTLEVEVR